MEIVSSGSMLRCAIQKVMSPHRNLALLALGAFARLPCCCNPGGRAGG